LSAVAVGALAPAAAALGGGPWADGVRAFRPGPGAGFGQQSLPSVVLGPPQGAGLVEGSTDVVSLGDGGRIVVAFRDNLVADGPGDDLVIFENAFHAGSESGPIFDELAFVEVSLDGRTWRRFAADPLSGTGMAGRAPVLANSGNGIDPTGPLGGGDRFDLAALGLSFVRLVRIVDAGPSVDDAGNHVPAGDKAGFDLDAVAALHSAVPGVVRGVVRAGGAAVAGAFVRLVPLRGGRRPWRRSRDSGRFRFWPAVPEGSYRVKARRKGLGRARTTVSLTATSRVARVTLDLR